MNREALDEFFAKAEDVLEHWEPSDDAMVARMADEDADLPLADSYYSQGSPVGGWLEWFASQAMSQWQRSFLDVVLYGQSFIYVRPEGIVHIPVVPVTRWIEFDRDIHVPTIEHEGFSILREWRDELTVDRASRELDERYPLVDWGRFKLAEECPTQADDVVVPRLPAEVWDRCERRQLARELTTGPRVRVGLDGHYRRHA